MKQQFAINSSPSSLMNRGRLKITTPYSDMKVPFSNLPASFIATPLCFLFYFLSLYGLDVRYRVSYKPDCFAKFGLTVLDPQSVSFSKGFIFHQVKTGFFDADPSSKNKIKGGAGLCCFSSLSSSFAEEDTVMETPNKRCCFLPPYFYQK
ncbi:hypothetical protein TNCV_3164291 [Trichonephila clavipes]|nr:hypothetical protein TNCV_3164291 [Trichonephila clavipes]